LRRLLTTSCLTPLALIASAAGAATMVTGTTTTTIDTATLNGGAGDDVEIRPTGTVMPAGAGPGLIVDNGHAGFIDQGGRILLDGTDGAIGVVVAGANRNALPGAIENDGLIQLDESYRPALDAGGNPDGPFAMASGRTGIRLVVATGDVINGSTGQIIVRGQNSTGIETGNENGVTQGSIVNLGLIDVTGENSRGVEVNDGINGDIRIGGTVNVSGPNASGVVLNRGFTSEITGMLQLSGNLTVTGYRFPTPPANLSQLDADDLLGSGPAVLVNTDVTDGIELTSSANVRALGGTGLAIGDGSGPVTIGPTSGSNGFGLEVDGSLLSDGVYSGHESTGIQLGADGGGASIAGGIRVTGSVTARAVGADATAVSSLFENVTTPQIRNDGTISAQTTGATSSARGILLNEFGGTGSIATIRNTGTIQAVATGGRSATAIEGSSDSFNLIVNSGTISASGVAGSGSNRAIDASGNSADLVVRQMLAAPGAAAPRIVGDVILGRGNNLVDIQAGTVAGRVLFQSGGADRLQLSGTAALTGAIIASGATGGGGSIDIALSNSASATGDLSLLEQANLSLKDTSKITGNVTAGSGAPVTIALANGASLSGQLNLASAGTSDISLADNAKYAGNALLSGGKDVVTLSGSAGFTGQLSTGAGNDSVLLQGNATLNAANGGIDLGDGNDDVDLEDGSTVAGKVSFGNGAGTLGVFDGAKLTGDVSFRDGGDTIELDNLASLTGNVLFSGGNNSLDVAGASSLTGNVTFGSGTAAITVSGASRLTGRLDLGGGKDFLGISGTGRFTGTLAGSQNTDLVVNGGTLDLTGIQNVPLNTLQVLNGGTLTVNIDAAARTATHYLVSGEARFAAGSKLLLRPTGIFTDSAHLALITAGSITGGDNLTANDIAVPILFLPAKLTRTATEIALDVVRRPIADLGLNDAGKTAIDPIVAAAASDPKVGAVLANIPDPQGLRRAVSSLLPNYSGGLFETVTAGARAFARGTEGGGTPRIDHDRWAIWMDHVYWNSSKASNETAGYRATGWGTAGGAEAKTRAGNFGASIGYLRGRDRDTDTEHNEVRTKQYEYSLYWHGDFGAFHPYAWASDAVIHFNSRRQFAGSTGSETIVRTSNGRWLGNLISLEGGASYEQELGGIRVRPNLSLDYNRLHEDNFEEHGGGSAVDLIVNSRKSDELAGNATLNLGIGSVRPERAWFTAEVEGGRREILSGRLGNTTAHFAGGSPFTLLPEDRKGGWVERARASFGRGAGRISGEVSAEQHEGRTNVATRVTLQVSL